MCSYAEVYQGLEVSVVDDKCKAVFEPHDHIGKLVAGKSVSTAFALTVKGNSCKELQRTNMYFQMFPAKQKVISIAFAIENGRM